MKSAFSFDILARHGSLARAGVIHTPHGDIETPTFTVVGTHGRVKCLGVSELRAVGVQAVLANGYHLLRRAVQIDASGGLAEWNGWRGPTLTDSGGFQVMSLGSGLGKIVSMEREDGGPDSLSSVRDFRLSSQGKSLSPRRNCGRPQTATPARPDRKLLSPHRDCGRPQTATPAHADAPLAFVDDDGVEFRDPHHGRIVKFTPEKSIQTQHQIGADIMMAFDELTNIGDSYDYNVTALERTRRWAERSLAEHARLSRLRADRPYQALLGVLQGAHYQDLREQAAHQLAAMTVDGAEFDGFGLGGAFEKERLGQIIAYMTRILPESKPRHLLGLGRPEDIFTGVENGCDTFDCVAPTREARHGRVYTLDGPLNLRRAEFAHDPRPLDPDCDCPTCQSGRTRADWRALLKSPELAASAHVLSALSQHNVRFIVRLTEQIRAAIRSGEFDQLRTAWLGRWYRK